LKYSYVQLLVYLQKTGNERSNDIQNLNLSTCILLHQRWLLYKLADFWSEFQSICITNFTRTKCVRQTLANLQLVSTHQTVPSSGNALSSHHSALRMTRCTVRRYKHEIQKKCVQISQRISHKLKTKRGKYVH
jgi:hypothetical protein